MHHDEFDTLSRALVLRTSRRPTILGLFGGLLAIVPWAVPGSETEARKGKKKKRKRRRRRKKRSLPLAPPPNSPPPPCVRDCTGKACGDDGCGESCGECSDGKTCQGGSCACPEDTCDGACVPACAPGSQREDDSCDCCLSSGTTCTTGTVCCSGSCDFLLDPPGGVCAPCRGRTCSATNPCCDGLSCIGNFCDGCRDRGTFCTSSTQCCFSDCTGNACLSNLGGRCARNVDCRACYQDTTKAKCPGACVGGVCTV